MLATAAVSQEVETHTYDELGRLISTQTSGPNSSFNDDEARSYCYDALGNRTDLKASTDNSVLACPAPSPAATPPVTPSPTPTPPAPPTNSPPYAVDDAVWGNCGASTSISVTANDSDAEDSPIKPQLVSITKLSGFATASVVSGNVSLNYGGYSGFSVFSYTIEDSDGATGAGTLEVQSGGSSCMPPP